MPPIEQDGPNSRALDTLSRDTCELSWSLIATTKASISDLQLQIVSARQRLAESRALLGQTAIPPYRPQVSPARVDGDTAISDDGGQPWFAAVAELIAEVEGITRPEWTAHRGHQGRGSGGQRSILADWRARRRHCADADPANGRARAIYRTGRADPVADRSPRATMEQCVAAQPKPTRPYASRRAVSNRLIVCA